MVCGVRVEDHGDESACAPAGEGVPCEAHDGVGGGCGSDDEGVVGERDVLEVFEGDGPAHEVEEGPDSVAGVGQGWGAGGVGDDEAVRVEARADDGGTDEDEGRGDEGGGMRTLEGADEGDGTDGNKDGIDGEAHGGVEDGRGGLAGQFDAIRCQACDAPVGDAVGGLEREGVGEDVGIEVSALPAESCGEDEAEEGAQGCGWQSDDDEEPADGEEGVAQEWGAAGGAGDDERQAQEGEVEEEGAHGAAGVEFGEFAVEGVEVDVGQGWGPHGTRVSDEEGSMKAGSRGWWSKYRA